MKRSTEETEAASGATEAKALAAELIAGLNRLADVIGVNEARWIGESLPQEETDRATAVAIARHGLLAVQWCIEYGGLPLDSAKRLTDAHRRIVGTKHDEQSLFATLDAFAVGHLSEEYALTTVLVLMDKLDTRPRQEPNKPTTQGFAGFENAAVARKCLTFWKPGKGRKKKGVPGTKELYSELMKHLGHAIQEHPEKHVRTKVRPTKSAKK
jgi:hypothetical protein